MSRKTPKILILVEGAKTDVKLMKHLLDVYGISEHHQIVSYNTNIYTLYKEMFADNDPDSMDLLQVLKSREHDMEKKKLFDEDYSDIRPLAKNANTHKELSQILIVRLCRFRLTQPFFLHNTV